MATIYKSKIDSWVFIVLGAAVAVSAYSSVTILFSGSSDDLWMSFVTIVLGIGLPLWLLITTRYTLDSEMLTVRGGPLKWRIPVKDITAITPTRNVLASPALSMDRLRINYGRNRSVMISPRDKTQFLKDIEALRVGSIST